MINLWIESRENCNKTATVTRHFSKMYLYKIFNETLGRNYISGYKSYQCSDCDKAFSSPALMKKTFNTFDNTLWGEVLPVQQL